VVDYTVIVSCIVIDTRPLYRGVCACVCLLGERSAAAVAVREWQSNAKLLRLIEVLQNIKLNCRFRTVRLCLCYLISLYIRANVGFTDGLSCY